MTALLWWAAGAEAAGAVLLVTGHYLILHGWGDRLLAAYYGRPEPEPTAHARWERSWGRRQLLTVYGLALASVLMLAAAWQYSPGAGIALAGVAELAASLASERARRRAAQAEGRAHGQA